jgi:magnesium transporter
MIKIFKTTKDGLEEIREIEKNCWVNFSNPTNGELGELLEKLNIPLNFLTDPLDVDERARSEMEDKCVLIILRISHFDEKREL